MLLFKFILTIFNSRKSPLLKKVKIIQSEYYSSIATTKLTWNITKKQSEKTTSIFCKIF